MVYWSSTDMPETLLPVFGYTCNNPTTTADDIYGSSGRDNCSYNGGPESFHPPQRRLARDQQHVSNIYSFNGTNSVQAAMCDGSVRSISTNIALAPWSAAVTPASDDGPPLD